jgi:predicted O-methyltransferase YrrM
LNFPLLQKLKLFKYEFQFVKSRSDKFSLLLHLELWLKDRILNQNPMQAGFPWINYTTIQFMHHLISKNMRVVECGAGGSSIFFLTRGVRLTSIEHNEKWIKIVRNKVDRKIQNNWDYHLIKSDNGITNIPSAESYLLPLDHLSDSSIDLFLIDGRHRVESVKKAINKIKPGGFLILDNCDRPEYAKSFELLTDWSLKKISCITNSSEFVTPAAIWKKPSLG